MLAHRALPLSTFTGLLSQREVSVRWQRRAFKSEKEADYQREI